MQDFSLPNLDTGSKWTCLVFLTDSKEDFTIDFFRHKRTNICEINTENCNVTEKDILEGYTGGVKLKDALLRDLADPSLWKKEQSVSIRNNKAIFFKSDIPHNIPKEYFEKGIIQVFLFGDDNVN